MLGKGTGGDVMPYLQFFVCKLEPERATLAAFHVAAVLQLYLSNNLSSLGLLTYAFVIIMNLEKKQTRAQFFGFFHVIGQLKEDIKNNNNYVAGVVHDLRNPLTEIYSCTELLTQTLPEHLLNNPDMLQLVNAFKRNAENLISMVSNILDYAKIKAKKLELDL